MLPGADGLPHVDEHSAVVGAGAAVAWEAMLAVIEGSFSTPAAARVAHLLGCADPAVGGPRPLAPGASFPGFRVERAERPRLLALRGRHRFSDYALIMRIDELGSERVLLRAETRAEFPGLHGRAYRALVIGTRGHVLVTRRLLAAVRRRAERG
jgi:hypothetical protein